MYSNKKLEFGKLQGNNISVARRAKIESTGLHWHNYYEMIFFFDGHAESIINGTATEFKKGSIYILTPFDIHKTESLNQNLNTDFVNISFKEGFIDNEIISEIDGVFLLNCIKESDLIYR